MAQQVINTGTFPNDATGDPAQTAFIKINSNFGQLFGTVAGLTFGPPPTPPGGTAVTIFGATPPTLPALNVFGPTLLNGQTGGAPALTVNAVIAGAAAQFIGAVSNPVSVSYTDGQAGNTVWSVNVGAAAVGEFEIINNTAAITPLKIATNGGLVVGTATGASQGAGTVNAQGLFINGVAVVPGAGNSAYILALVGSPPSIVQSLRITSPAIVRNSVGNYTITHNLGTSAYGVSATVLQNSGVAGIITVSGISSTAIGILSLVSGVLSDAIGDVYFNFVF